MKLSIAIFISLVLHGLLFFYKEQSPKQSIMQTQVVRVQIQTDKSMPNSNKKLKQITKKLNQKADSKKEVLTQNKNGSLKKSEYILKVLNQIESKKFYPPKAKRLGHTGRVLLSFKILRNGQVRDLKIAKKSNFSSLNKAALSLIKSIEFFPPLPPKYTKEELILEVPIEYIN